MNSVIRCPFSYNVGYCEFQCVKDYYKRSFNCVLDGTQVNRCHRMKTMRMLLEKHRTNLTSYAKTVIPESKFSEFESSFHEFSTTGNKLQAMTKIISLLSRAHETFVIEDCQQQCLKGKAPLFCNSWEIFMDKTYSKETLYNVDNKSKLEVHDIDVGLRFKVKRNMLVYEQVLTFSLGNFVGQIGGLIGLYVGWSFLSVGKFLAIKLPELFRRPFRESSKTVQMQKQIQDMMNVLETMQKRIKEMKV